MTAGGEAVGRLLHALDERLRPTARASWVAADGAREVAGAPLAPEVADVLPGLAQLLQRSDRLFAQGAGRVTFEAGDRVVLVHALGAHGMTVIDAGEGLNLALVRLHAEAVLAEHAAHLPAAVAPTPAPERPARSSVVPGQRETPGADGPATAGRTGLPALPPRQPAVVAGTPVDRSADGPTLGRVLEALLDHDV